MKDWLEEKFREIKQRDKSKTKMRLAKELKIAPARITEIIKGERAIQSDEIRQMAKFLEISEQQLLDRLSDGPLRSVTLGVIMVKGTVEAGGWREAIVWPEADWRPAPIAADARYPEARQYGLEVHGPSMDKIYPPGTVLVCVGVFDYRKDPEPLQNVIVQRRGADGRLEITVKELRKDGAGKYWLWPRSKHPEFQQPWAIPSLDPFDENDDLRVIAVVIGSYKPE